MLLLSVHSIPHHCVVYNNASDKTDLISNVYPLTPDACDSYGFRNSQLSFPDLGYPGEDFFELDDFCSCLSTVIVTKRHRCVSECPAPCAQNGSE